jgi:hypothetical protein
MPSAIANIIAKFMAQMDTSANCPTTNSNPPAPRRPAIVSSSGRPAATSVPKAASSSASVSGHDSISDLSIAALLAPLKSDHIAAGPVRRTASPGADSRARRVLSLPAASTIPRGVAPARPTTTAVPRSGDVPSPARGASTPATAASLRSTARTRARVARIAGPPAGGPDTTTESA